MMRSHTDRWEKRIWNIVGTHGPDAKRLIVRKLKRQFNRGKLGPDWGWVVAQADTAIDEAEIIPDYLRGMGETDGED